MDQAQQQNVTAWPCVDQAHLQANLPYQVTQERGYSVTRRVSVEVLGSPAPPSPETLPHNRPRRKVIAFPQRPKATVRESDDFPAMIQTWLELASTPRRIPRVFVAGENIVHFELLNGRKKQERLFPLS